MINEEIIKYVKPKKGTRGRDRSDHHDKMIGYHNKLHRKYIKSGNTKKSELHKKLAAKHADHAIKYDWHSPY